MPDLTAKPGAAAPGPLLASLFSKAHGLEMTEAVLTALLCGGATGLLVAKPGHWISIVLGALLGVLIALVAYIAIAPESVVTACLVSARKRFLDDQITVTECYMDQKKCLRKSLLF